MTAATALAALALYVYVCWHAWWRRDWSPRGRSWVSGLRFLELGDAGDREAAELAARPKPTPRAAKPIPPGVIVPGMKIRTGTGWCLVMSVDSCLDRVDVRSWQDGDTVYSTGRVSLSELRKAVS